MRARASTTVAAGTILTLLTLPGLAVRAIETVEPNPDETVARANGTGAPKQQWVPTASLAIGSFDQRLRVRVDGSDTDSNRGQLRTFVALGLAHPIARLPNERTWIDGVFAVGAGPTFYTGHWLLPLSEDVTFAFAGTRWLTLRGGLGAGLTIDASAGRQTFAELALPIGLTFFRTIDLVYRPLLSVPLGGETTSVFGGERELSTRLAILPFELLLRVRIAALSR